MNYLGFTKYAKFGLTDAIAVGKIPAPLTVGEQASYLTKSVVRGAAYRSIFYVGATISAAQAFNALAHRNPGLALAHGIDFGMAYGGGFVLGSAGGILGGPAGAFAGGFAGGALGAAGAQYINKLFRLEE